ncbi:MAG: hypothetical protein PHI11_10905 [Gallionella sp.]|nr:hypothetical protein [Gallionella sp.]
MISLKPKLPDNFKHEDFIQKVVEERQKQDKFKQVTAAWKSCVELYIKKGGNPEVVKPEPAIQKVKETILGLYSRTDPSNATVQGVIIPLREDGRLLQFCPLCGEAGTPNTLDHYLPKSKYPEFAILPHNLIPACDICQGKKSNETLDKNNQRCFLHPYFDSVEKQLIQLDIGTPFDAPRTFDIVPHSKLTGKEKNLVQRHIDGLNINDRFKNFFASEHRKLIRLVTEELPKTGMSVKIFVKFCKDMNAEITRGKNSLLKKESNSLNSWSHIFYHGVLNNEAFMFYLESITTKQGRGEVAQIEPEIVAKFKATAGNNWETEINNVLKEWLKIPRLPHSYLNSNRIPSILVSASPLILCQ